MGISHIIVTRIATSDSAIMQGIFKRHTFESFGAPNELYTSQPSGACSTLFICGALMFVTILRRLWHLFIGVGVDTEMDPLILSYNLFRGGNYSLVRKITEKVKLSLCLTNQALRHEDVWRSGCIDPHFLDLGTSWR
jgi:hypothetical protein